MKWFRMMIVFAAMLLFSPIASAQVGPGGPEGPGDNDPPNLCHQCCDLEFQIELKQGLYEAIDREIDEMLDEITELEAMIAAINASPALTPEEKAVLVADLQADIDAKQEIIAAKEVLLQVYIALIQSLWDQWFALGCDTADC